MNHDSPVTIFRATISDVTGLTQLSIDTFCETFAHQNSKEDMDLYIAEEMNEARLAAELAEADNLFFIAWQGETMAGYVKMRTQPGEPSIKECKAIEIERIYVRGEFQGKKVGASLMGRCLEFAANENFDTVWLGVWEYNYKAVNFYRQWGFELFGSHPFILGKDIQTDVLMKKAL